MRIEHYIRPVVGLFAATIAAGILLVLLLSCERPRTPEKEPIAKPPVTVTSISPALAAFRACADNRVAVRTSFGVRSARPISSNKVGIVIGMSVGKACGNPDAYRIISYEDEAYAYPKFVRPARASARREKEADGARGCGFKTFERTIVTLDLPTPMKEGREYYVMAQGAGSRVLTGGHTAQGFTYQKSVDRDQTSEVGDVDNEDVDLAVLGLRRVEPVGPRIIMLEFGPNFAPKAGTSPANYHVTVNGKTVDVVNLGRITKVDAYIPVGWPFRAIPYHQLFLELSQPFKDGDEIAVTVHKSVTRAASSAKIVFRERETISNSIKVNQVGYLTDSPVKIAYLGRWMGSFPETGGPSSSKAVTNPSMLFDEPPTFYVCSEETGDCVFTGRTQLIHTSGTFDEGAFKADHSGENVYLIDFTKFGIPGRYFISVPQVGRSLPFTIADDVYAEAFRTQGYGVFAQRCGIELKPPYSEWRRIACHTNGILPTTQLHFEPHKLKDLAHLVDYSRVRRAAGDKDKAVALRASGGHHDAGDYNPRSHLDVAQSLMDAWEIAPQKFYDGQLNIPENTNGVPDILDESAWALKLWLGLQDSDGGVFNGTESNGDPNFIQTVELDRLGDYAYAKDAAGSFNFAGAMAQASRILKELGNKRKARMLLNKALRAYDWALAHPPESAKTESDKLTQFLSPKACAAAELLLTTGMPRFNRDFIDACVLSKNPDAPLDVYKVYDQRRAAWAYARCADEAVDKKLRRTARNAIIRKADEFITNASTMAYAFIRHPRAPISWGTGAIPKWLDEVIWAWSLTGDEKYKYWMVRTCDNTLGANPLNRGFIVGLGTRTVRAPLHNSRYSHIGEVVKGMQVQGPNQRGEGYRVREIAYPKIRENFACLQTFVDNHFAIAMDEGTVDNMAKTMAVFGLLLADADERQPGRAIGD